MLRALFGALLVLAIAVPAAVSTPAAAVQQRTRATPTPTPTASPTPAKTPTPDHSVPPAAPSNVNLQGDVVRWNDNSDNEDGFEVRLTLGCLDGGEEHHRYTVSANTVSFQIPPEVRRVGFRPDGVFCGLFGNGVAAFNTAGYSSWDENFLLVEPSVFNSTLGALPSAGSSPLLESDGNKAPPLITVGVLLMLSGGFLYMIDRRHSVRG